MTWFARLATFAAALTLAVSATAAAQSTLAVADAGPFMGTWTMTLESPQGAFEQSLVLSDKGGKVTGELTSPISPTPTTIDDITKDGNDLVLKFEGDFQGNAFTATVRLILDGSDKANVTFDVMNGQFVMSGKAVKK